MHYLCKKPKLKKVGRGCCGYLVTYPVSYTYNGGIVINNKWYEGFRVPRPSIPDGFELVDISIGLQLNAKPPLCTQYLKPTKRKYKT